MKKLTYSDILYFQEFFVTGQLTIRNNDIYFGDLMVIDGPEHNVTIDQKQNKNEFGFGESTTLEFEGSKAGDLAKGQGLATGGCPLPEIEEYLDNKRKEVKSAAFNSWADTMPQFWVYDAEQADPFFKDTATVWINRQRQLAALTQGGGVGTKFSFFYVYWEQSGQFGDAIPNHGVITDPENAVKDLKELIDHNASQLAVKGLGRPNP